MDLKYVTGPITKADAGGIEAVISTPKVDKDGESVDPLGLVNKDEWLTNPLIYWAHEWAFDPTAEPIGKGTALDVSRDAITSKAVYAPTPKAQNVRALVTGGFVRKTSIGFDSQEFAEIKGVPTHVRWALREWSIVPMPSNTDATIFGVKSALRWLADEIAEPVAPPASRHMKINWWVDEKGLTVMDVEATTDAVLLQIDPVQLVAALERLPELGLHADETGVALVERGKRLLTMATSPRRRVASFP